ncbi:hypothetical protein GF359_00645 [candidate division WOR-3 bacterium]|uniref:Sigma-54 factor interaction domain-containing protein n=1 Tax=candidate division WOR-3 bacterium TaxID=2052148 RepID=A0A9D5QC66_UNCW3|nr:hypothetical protein [candidate division WOR-3 bacterium]MBD3363701.1 hypothetical protein [candidate division WOR-3 bacterium]
MIDIQVPPLRVHKDDIPELVEYFLETACLSMGVPSKTLEKPAMDKLMKFNWPGNVRQLRNTIEKIVALNPALVIESKVIPESINGDGSIWEEDKALPLSQARKRFERDYIVRILEAEDWNVAAAAKRLGLDRTHLHRKIKALKVRRK